LRSIDTEATTHRGTQRFTHIAL